jgi:hypothetical protein
MQCPRPLAGNWPLPSDPEFDLFTRHTISIAPGGFDEPSWRYSYVLYAPFNPPLDPSIPLELHFYTYRDVRKERKSVHFSETGRLLCLSMGLINPHEEPGK